jgi:hypothetical protein
MPQVDIITFFLIIFWFTVFLLFGFFSLNKNSLLLLLNFQKKINIFFEFFTGIVLYNKKNNKIIVNIEENNSLKF